MGSESTQSKLDRVRKPRVHIKYEVETEGAAVEKELPFVVGVLGDFSGQPTEPLKPLKDRKFIQVDRDNFNDVMARMTPGLNLKVKNTLKDDGTEMGVQLKFGSIDDFNPENVAQQIDPVKKLLETRDKLRDLLTKMDRSEDLEAVLEKVLSNTDELKKLRDAGIKVDTPWHNLTPAGETAWWIDPTGSKMGDAGKYFKYNPTDAKALLSAAAATFPDTITYQYTANRYGKLFNDIAEANVSYMQAIGLKTTTEVQDYSSKYITQTFIGNFKGVAFGYETPFPEAGSYLTRFFTDNPQNHSKWKDPEMLKIAQDAQVELSEEKRKELFAQAQIKNAQNMYYIPNVAGAGTGWTVSQSGLRNFPEFVTKSYGGPSETLPFRWKA